MNQLFNIGFNDEEIKDILDSNPLWKESLSDEVIEYLLTIFKEEELKEIIYSNPYILSRDKNDLKELLEFLLANVEKEEILSNPTILNYQIEEILKN